MIATRLSVGVHKQKRARNATAGAILATCGFEVGPKSGVDLARRRRNVGAIGADNCVTWTGTGLTKVGLNVQQKLSAQCRAASNTPAIDRTVIGDEHLTTITLQDLRFR